MAENKKKVIVYCDWKSTFDALTNEEAGVLIKHFFSYINDENPQSDRLTELLFLPIKQTLKRDLYAWEIKQERNKMNGQKGGRPATQNNPKKPKITQGLFLKPKKGDSVSDSVSDSVFSKENFLLKKETKENTNEQKLILFDSFWSIYNKKTGREKAMKSFLRLSFLEINELMNVVSKYVQSTPDKQYRKDATTYLNGKHWKDEIIFKTKQNEQSNSNQQAESFEDACRRRAEAFTAKVMGKSQE